MSSCTALKIAASMASCLGAALGSGGGPIGFDVGAAEGSGPGSPLAIGVSGANVVAGGDAMDDARLGMIIGKSAIPYRGASRGWWYLQQGASLRGH